MRAEVTLVVRICNHGSEAVEEKGEGQQEENTNRILLLQLLARIPEEVTKIRSLLLVEVPCHKAKF